MQPQIPTVTVDQVPDGAFVLDVRDHHEWRAGHAPDAHHVPMGEIPARMGEVPSTDEVVVACRAGGRSAKVVAFLQANGRDNVVNLDGGMQAWARAGRPLVVDGRRKPRII